MNAKSFNRPSRKVYIVTETPGTPAGAGDLQIIEVKPEQEEAFLKDYEGRIVATGNSIQEVIMKFSELLKS